MKKVILSLIITVSTMLSTVWAYSFSAVSPSGHTLYYEIISGTTNVGVVSPGIGTTFYNYISGNVVIPDTVSYNDTTYNVTELKVVDDYGTFYNCSGLTSVVIPNSVTTIGEYAFYYCTSLTSIIIPNSVITIGESAFGHCSGLTSVTIPNSVVHIGSMAFEYCRGLTSITIPNSVTTIGDWAFEHCSSLTSIILPNSITSIESYAFFYCSGLTSVTIPNSVTSIGTYAFAYCSSLTSVTIPNSVTSIGNYAFSGCTGLTSVIIPNSVTYIGYYAFRNCSSLTSVTIPNSVTYIGYEAFYLVKNIIYSGTATGSPWGALSLNGYVDGDFIYSDSTKTTLTKYIGSAINVTIPNSVTFIGENAFSGCTGLTSLTIPNSVTSIGNYAFSECDSLSSITIPNSVTSIGNYAFSECGSLSSITIPDSVTSIGEGTFYECTALTSVTIPNLVTSIGENAFNGCSNLTSVTIPNLVTSIGNYAFRNCSGLTSLTIPNSVASIGGSAFRNCTSIGRIDLQSLTPPTIAGDSFQNVSSAIPVYIPCGSLSNYSNSAWSSQFSNLQETQVFSLGVTVNDSTMGMALILSNTCANTAIQAYPYDGYHFVSWNDGNTDNPRTITLTGDTNFIAYFAINNYTVTATSANDSMGTVSGGGSYEVGSQVTITATATEGYHFVSWNDGNTDNPRTITLTGDTTFVAYFERITDSTTGIEDIAVINAHVYSSRSRIVVEGANGNNVMLFDMNGRLLATKRDEYSRLEFEVPISGAYFVKIGNYKAKKIVVTK